MALSIGIILALFTIFLDSKYISYGIKNKDPLEDPLFLTKFAIPSLILELAFIIWVYIYLPTGVIFAILLLSISGLILKSMKMEGHKFYIYVLIPLSEILIIAFSMIKYCVNDI